MTIEQALPWVNLLLVPAIVLLGRITNQLAALSAVQREHARRLDRHDSDMGELWEAIRANG